MRIIAITVGAALLAFVGTQMPTWVPSDEPLQQSSNCRANGTCP